MADFEIGSAVAKIKADTSNFQEGLKKVSGGMEGLGGVVTKLGGILAGVFAVTKVISFGKEIVQNAQDAEKEMAIFEGIMSTTFGKTPKVFKEMRDAGLETSKAMIKLGFDDEETAVAFAKLAQATGNAKEANKMLSISADLARYKNIDLATAQNAVMLATMGNTRILKQMGIELDDNATKEEALAAVQSRVAGQAEAFAGTYAGSMATFNVEWTNLKETLGAYILPILTKVFGFLGNIIGAIQGATTEGGALTTMWQNLQQVWTDFMTFIQPLMDWFVATVVPQLQSIWAEISYFINTVIPPLVVVVQWLINDFLMPIILALVDFWKRNWDNIVLMLQSAWEIIKNTVLLAWNIVAGIITTGLLLLSGDWKGAWENIKKYTSGAWEALKGIFGGIINYLRGWGGWLWDELTSPFRRAWDEIQKVVNKIKDALDFTKRHSPSVVDIVERGVKLVNGAWDDLKVGLQPVDTSRFALAGVGSGNNMNPIINIDLTGAYIGDDSIGEKIGDAIISKLSKNVRF